MSGIKSLLNKKKKEAHYDIKLISSYLNKNIINITILIKLMSQTKKKKIFNIKLTKKIKTPINQFNQIRIQVQNASTNDKYQTVENLQKMIFVIAIAQRQFKQEHLSQQQYQSTIKNMTKMMQKQLQAALHANNSYPTVLFQNIFLAFNKVQINKIQVINEERILKNIKKWKKEKLQFNYDSSDTQDEKQMQKPIPNQPTDQNQMYIKTMKHNGIFQNQIQTQLGVRYLAKID